MSAIQALVSHFKANAAVRQRVGVRVYRQLAARKAALPYVVIERAGTTHERHQTAVAGLAESAFEVTCWATSADEAEDLADDLRKSLDMREHVDIGSQPNVITIRSAVLDNDSETLISDDAVGRPIFGVVMAWSLWHTETVPTF